MVAPFSREARTGLPSVARRERGERRKRRQLVMAKACARTYRQRQQRSRKRKLERSRQAEREEVREEAIASQPERAKFKIYEHVAVVVIFAVV